jgi:MOSC domain-containing protein YiiM
LIEGRIVSLRTGRVRAMARPEWDRHRDRTWRSGYVKDEAAGPLRATTIGLEGDEQYDRAAHGGEHMAVLAYAAAHYALWRQEPGLEAMGPGGFGENLTVDGLDEGSVCIGDVWESERVRFEVSQPRGPCANISRRWNAPTMVQRASDTARIGWYLRVAREGTIARGERLRLIERPHEGWTVERVFRLRNAPALDPEGVRWLAACEALSPEWRRRFARAAPLQR